VEPKAKSDGPEKSFMSAEFVDTNIFVYAHDGGAGSKHRKSVELLKRLFDAGTGSVSIQVLSEFYAAATGKLAMRSEEAEEIIRDLATWTLHRPSHADLLQAAGLHRKHKLSWWDALIVNSALQLGCSTLWSEDFSDGRRYGTVTVRSPFLI
jgi:predicted nucleic acid-binding protein